MFISEPFIFTHERESLAVRSKLWESSPGRPNHVVVQLKTQGDVIPRLYIPRIERKMRFSIVILTIFHFANYQMTENTVAISSTRDEDKRVHRTSRLKKDLSAMLNRIVFSRRTNIPLQAKYIETRGNRMRNTISQFNRDRMQVSMSALRRLTI